MSMKYHWILQIAPFYTLFIAFYNKKIRGSIFRQMCGVWVHRLSENPIIIYENLNSCLNKLRYRYNLIYKLIFDKNILSILSMFF